MNGDTVRPIALLLGCGLPNTLAAVRALGHKRIPLAVCGADDSYVTASRWFRPWPIPQSPSPDTLLTDLLRLPVHQRGVVIPCSDRWMQALTRIDHADAPGFRWCVPPADAADICLDKAQFADALDRLDLPRPRTWFPERGQMPPPAELTGCFVKPRDSFAFAARFEAKGFRLEDAAHAARVLETCQSAGLSVIVQELIPGPPTQHYMLDGFIDRHGRIAAMFARHRLRAQYGALSNSSCLVSLDPAVMAQPAADLERLLKNIGYRGIFSVEFKLDPRDGVFKFIEVNTRPWGDMALALRCGVDVMEMAWLDAQEHEVPAITRYKIGQHWISLFRDRVVCQQMIRAGELSGGSALRQWAGAATDIFALNDPLPLAAEMGRRLSRRWRRASHVYSPA